MWVVSDRRDGRFVQLREHRVLVLRHDDELLRQLQLLLVVRDGKQRCWSLPEARLHVRCVRGGQNLYDEGLKRSEVKRNKENRREERNLNLVVS